ncbi:ParB N-terminal domain-containing protein [Streptomyces sp. AP-93]|uniref:ParB/RepB/Spo0J family partition protein n=1 Tax=Streptomyces sp. AP-93 TaxID=2929048 RepID=UPI001FB00DB7|nr:ParB N-terminal domain-containing protein [Streptomyces sp. AP-93]MCJ0871854.1 ParB N-terminal domain-containing protein [Streptomyces sp. AP-93]
MAQSSAQAILITNAFGSVGTESADASARSEFDLKNLEQLPACDVLVNALSAGVLLRRSGTDAAHIQLLVDAAGSTELPPVLVQIDGYRIIDGLHRLEAAKLRGDSSIKARFVDCSNSEALVIAMQANGSHGLPLSKADRVSGAQRVLSSHPDWSDRAVGRITGLSAKTIASMREKSGEGAPLDGKRIGQDGRRRPVGPGEGRRRAAEYIAAHPGAPLRQVARETDVSLGTVHDVSARLRRGESPERNGSRTPDAAPQPLRSVHPAHPVRSVRPAGEPSRPAPADPGGADSRGAGSGGAGSGGAGSGGAALVSLRVAPTSSINSAPQRRNRTDEIPAWTTVAAKMATDPAVRYTAGGREFLRWMQLHAAEPDDGWRELIDAVPAHWLGVIAPIAERIGKEWSLLAEGLKTKQDTMP